MLLRKNFRGNQRSQKGNFQHLVKHQQFIGVLRNHFEQEYFGWQVDFVVVNFGVVFLEYPVLNLCLCQVITLYHDPNFHYSSYHWAIMIKVADGSPALVLSYKVVKSTCYFLI